MTARSFVPPTTALEAALADAVWRDETEPYRLRNLGDAGRRDAIRRALRDAKGDDDVRS